MLKPALILLAIATLFSQTAIARGGPPANMGNSAGMGQAPASIPVLNDAPLNGNSSNMDARGFDLPLDTPGTPLLQTPQAIIIPDEHISARLNGIDRRSNSPALQAYADAEQRAFADPLMNPGLSSNTSTSLRSETASALGTAHPAANDQRVNNQRVMARFADLTETDAIPPGIAKRQAALGYEVETLASPFDNPTNLDTARLGTQNDKAYDPFADTARDLTKSKAKDKTKTKQGNAKEKEENQEENNN